MGKGGFTLATYTEHYGLHQWESTDDFLRTDFNTDFAKIDEAIGEKPEVVFGSYTGNSTSGSPGTVQAVTLGFQPKLVVTQPSDGIPCRPGFGSAFLGYAGMCAPGKPASSGDADAWTLQTTADGFEVRDHDSVYCNSLGTVYYYLAVK